ncbi:MAG: alpha-L-rhamnosidase C-terminal domain-containing protein [Spirochaetota bacterium]
MRTSGNAPIFTGRPGWIWDESDPYGYNYYLKAVRTFRVTASERDAALRKGAELKITSDALYQVWLNGIIVGHGPAKSAENKRSVDFYRIEGLLNTGNNTLEVVVLSIGTGTMTYCPSKAGLIFEIDLGGGKTVVSDSSLRVAADTTRNRRTARRWLLPCIEDVNVNRKIPVYKRAVCIEKKEILYKRRIPLPSRTPFLPARFMYWDTVRLPDFSLTQRIKPYLVSGNLYKRNNLYFQKAYFITDIISPVEQDMIFTPTLGNVSWHFNGRLVGNGSGWKLCNLNSGKAVIRLRKGKNRLIGVHNVPDIFEDFNLAGFVEIPVKFQNPCGKGAFQVIPVDEYRVELFLRIERLKKGEPFPAGSAIPDMRPADSMLQANAQDLAVGAVSVTGHQSPFPIQFPLQLPSPEQPGHANRYIFDLGVLINGWINFTVTGGKGDILIFSFVEHIEEKPGLFIQWPDGSNNALRYTLKEGLQTYESFMPYGVRYIILHYQGKNPLTVNDLRVNSAYCGSVPTGTFRCSDALWERIYKICCNSLIAGIDDTYTDCPTFEQVNWNFDNRLSSTADMLINGNDEIIKNSIMLFSEDPRYPGLVRSQYPSCWDSRIPLWSFHWILWIKDYFLYSGQTDFVKEMYPRIRAGLTEGIGAINSAGLVEFHDVWHFVDWGHGRDDDNPVMTAEQGGFILALKAAAYLARCLGSPYRHEAKKWETAAAHLTASVNRHLWDSEKELYFDALHKDGSCSRVFSRVSNAIMVLCGAPEGEVKRKLMRRIINNDSALLPYGSPFGLYYILELYADAGEYRLLLDTVRARWGEMVAAGDTTVWETFSEFGLKDRGVPTRSRCHPMAAYIVKYIIRYLLGIEALRPGFAEFRVNPVPLDLRFAEGSIPTPEGAIKVAWEKMEHGVDCRVIHPAGLRKNNDALQ